MNRLLPDSLDRWVRSVEGRLTAVERALPSAGSPPVGSVMLFAGGGAPRGWVRCDGSVLPWEGSGLDRLRDVVGVRFGGEHGVSWRLPDLGAADAAGGVGFVIRAV